MIELNTLLSANEKSDTSTTLSPVISVTTYPETELNASFSTALKSEASTIPS